MHRPRCRIYNFQHAMAGETGGTMNLSGAAVRARPALQERLCDAADALAYFEGLVRQGGPRADEYEDACECLDALYSAYRNGTVTEATLARLRLDMGEALTPRTMQGFAYVKPHGYAGDFEIIDRIYTQYICREPHLAKWDRFYHSQAAPKAVRNRKSYFQALMRAYAPRKSPLRVLKIASGPGRSMFEYFRDHPDTDVRIDCIELDANAIAYAKRLNGDFLDRVSFQRENALRFRPSAAYDVIWAAGIFDYFSDRVFVSLTRRLRAALAPDGELVIGNFSDDNPSRSYMELVGDWMLYHRSRSELRRLAMLSGASAHEISVSSEPEGVNLFLHVRHPHSLGVAGSG
jgi:extracellular factor (EF) 3-hydroxypalmitic acid methyl ester biosynthesis protein